VAPPWALVGSVTTPGGPAELASTYAGWGVPKKAAKKAKEGFLDSVVTHDHIIANLDRDAVVCYTDGSASPNPGPAGSGASVFFSNAHVTDLGSPVGCTSNNFAELYAIGICLAELSQVFMCSPASKAVVFSDSLYAIQAVTSKKTPTSHVELTNALRALFSRVLASTPTSLVWIRGHCGAGGNERVDRIAKGCAKVSTVATTLVSPTAFHCSRQVSEWPFYHESLGVLPLQMFLTRLPQFSEYPGIALLPATPSPYLPLGKEASVVPPDLVLLDGPIEGNSSMTRFRALGSASLASPTRTLGWSPLLVSRNALPRAPCAFPLCAHTMPLPYPIAHCLGGGKVSPGAIRRVGPGEWTCHLRSR